MRAASTHIATDRSPEDEPERGRFRRQAALAGPALLAEEQDERLVELAADGQEHAFEAIVRRYRRPLLAYCSRLLPAGLVEDAVQQALLNAYQGLRRGDRIAQLRPWLYRIARNAAIDASRARSPEHEALGTEPDGAHRADPADEPERVAQRRERLDAVVGGLQRLPERQRAAIVLREIEGRSYDEIAETLGVSGGSVRQLLNRARTTLRRAVPAFVAPIHAVKRLWDSGPGRMSRLSSALPAGSPHLKVGAGAAVAATAIVATAELPLAERSAPPPHAAPLRAPARHERHAPPLRARPAAGITSPRAPRHRAPRAAPAAAAAGSRTRPARRTRRTTPSSTASGASFPHGGHSSSSGPYAASGADDHDATAPRASYDSRGSDDGGRSHDGGGDSPYSGSGGSGRSGSGGERSGHHGSDGS